MGLQRNIQNVIFARLATASLPVSWPNGDGSGSAFTPPADGKYLEAFFLPNANRRPFYSGDDPEYKTGILQVDVVCPLNIGAGYAAGVADDIATLFPSDDRLTGSGLTIVIQRTPDVAPAIKGDTNWRVPVSVRYELFA